MAYEKVTDLSCDTVHKLGGKNEKTNKANPTELEGYYLGFRVVNTANGESKIHVFQTPNGNEGTWGSKDLNDKLSQVVPGAMVLVEFTGKKRLQGGKTLNTFSVQQDKANTIDINPYANSASNEATESYAADDTTDDTVDEDAEQTAALIAAERAAKAAKVQEILNRGKTKVK